MVTGRPDGHGEVRVRDCWMACPDGVRLATRLWEPQGDGPWPVLLMRQPYGRAIASTVTYAHPRWYAERGFLVAVQDVRGRGDSEGHFSGFITEAGDSAAAVVWARTLPGANGRVGTYGFSYQGLTQLLNAGGTEQALPDCLAPAMAGLDEARHWACEGGAHWWGLALTWALQLAAEGCRRRCDHQGWWEIRHCLAAGSQAEQGPQLLERLDPGGMGLRWLRLDPHDAGAWCRHEPSPALLRRPMLLIGGWQDPHLIGVLDLWRRSRRAGGLPSLVVGPWSHLDWGGGLDALHLAFFRRHLHASAGIASPMPEPADPSLSLPPALAEAAAGGMALAAEGAEGPTDWFTPQPHAAGPDATGWQLLSDGRAAISCEEGALVAEDQPAAAALAGVVVVVHDPWRPVPARGGHLGLPPGQVDRADLDRRGDVACFTTAPLEVERLLLGRPALQLEARADQPGFDLCAALSLLPAGERRVLQLSTGFLRIVGAGALALAWRRVALQPLAAQLRPGDRLRLSIAAAAWPAIAVNPGDGSTPWGGAGPQHRVISLELHLRGASLGLEPLLSTEAGSD